VIDVMVRVTVRRSAGAGPLRHLGRWPHQGDLRGLLPQPELRCLQVLLPMWVADAQATIEVESAIASACSYAYAFGLGDAVFAGLVGYPNTVVRPDVCLQP
jgi:hypothetical protein